MSLGVISTSQGIALTKAYFPPAPRGVRTPPPLLLAPAWRIHLQLGSEIPEDYYTQARTSTKALISLTGPKQVHLLRQRRHRRWPAFKTSQPGTGDGRSRVELPAVRPCLRPWLNGLGSSRGCPREREGCWWYPGAEGTS